MKKERKLWSKRKTDEDEVKEVTPQELEEFMRDRHPNFFTDKQFEFMNNSLKKYNFYVGAAGAGKSFLAWYLIPMMIVTHCKDTGSVVIIGNTLTSVERNILDPMRAIHGEDRVSKVYGKSNTCYIYGRLVYIFGGDKEFQAKRIQGLNVQYVYGDEVATWNEEVFGMLTGRLREWNSRFDGACNPKGSKHWLKQWLDLQASHEEDMVYALKTTLDDAFFSSDPEVDARIKREMKAGYGDPTGALYRRFVDGEWVDTEGLIYTTFGEKPGKFFIDKKDLPKLSKIVIGVDFGGTKSDHAFVATGFSSDNQAIYVLKSRKTPAMGRGPEELNEDYILFLREVENEYGMTVDYTYADNAEPVLINGMKSAMRRAGLNRAIFNASKRPVNDRIKATTVLIGLSRFYYTEDAMTVRDALLSAQWNSSKDSDERLDDFTSDIDTLDAFEYTFERDINKLTKI